jgi:hypothetical protein
LILFVFASVSIGARAQNEPSPLRFQLRTSSSSISSSSVSAALNGSVPKTDDAEVAENAAAMLPYAPAAAAQTAQAAEPPPQMKQTAQDIKYEARRWHLGGRIGVGFSPELFMFGVQSQIGPIFSRRFLLRPNADFSFGELTDMFALNLEGAYRLRTAVYRRWTPYIGMGPSLNFIHQGTSTSDVSFSDFTYKTGFNVFAGAQKGKTFVEMKTALWSGPAPVLRLVLGYNF